MAYDYVLCDYLVIMYYMALGLGYMDKRKTELIGIHIHMLVLYHRRG